MRNTTRTTSASIALLFTPSSNLKVGNILAMDLALSINLNIDGVL